MLTPLISENIAASQLMLPLTLVVIPLFSIGQFFSSVHSSLDAAKNLPKYACHRRLLEEFFRVKMGRLF